MVPRCLLLTFWNFAWYSLDFCGHGTREMRWRAFIWSRFLYANAATLWATSIWYLYFMHIIYRKSTVPNCDTFVHIKKSTRANQMWSYLKCRPADGTFLASRAPHQPLPSRTDSHFFFWQGRSHSRSVLHMSKRRGRTARARLRNRTLETTFDHGKGLQLRIISIFSNEITEPRDPLHSCTRY